MSNLMKKFKTISKSALSLLLVVVLILTSIPITSQAATKNTSITVSNQTQLEKALKDKSLSLINIETLKAQEFNVPNHIYRGKTLVINAPKATFSNSGRFKSLIVAELRVMTENAKGNTFTVKDKKVTFKVTKGAEVKAIIVSKKAADLNVMTDGIIRKMVLAKKTGIALTGDITNHIVIQINKAAKGSSIISDVPVDVTTAADISITLEKGAEKSAVTSTDEFISLEVINNTTKSLKITTPDGKKTVAKGKTLSLQNEPTKTPEHSEDTQKEPTKTPEKSGDSQNEPTKAPEKSEDSQSEPTKVPEKTTSGTENIPPADGTIHTTYYTVSFNSDGGTPIDSVKVAAGNAITNLAIPQKDGFVFLGWYTDSAHQNKFTEKSVVYSDLTLYARYSEIVIYAQNKIDYFTLTEQQPELSFSIVSTDTAMTPASVKNAMTLDIADGSEAVELAVTGSQGAYLLNAQNGFTEGASYTLTLNDSRLNFEGKESTIRKCSFTIKKAEVYNLQLDKGIKYIPRSDISNITKCGNEVEDLSVAVVDLTENSNKSIYGSFTYNNNTVINTGDILCIYKGDKPASNTSGVDDTLYMGDDISYVKVTDVKGSIGSQMISYTDTDADEVLFMPDVLPISVGEGNKLTDYSAATENATGSFKAAISDLNFSSYSAMGLTAETTIDQGDYLAFYTGTYNDNSDSSSVNYAKVTDVVEKDGKVEVTFTSATWQELKNTMDYFSKKDVDSETLLQDTDIASVEKEIEEQVKKSDYAEESSVYLTKLAMETDGFQELTEEGYNLEDLSVELADGSDADLNQISSMSSSSASPKVSVKNLVVNADIGNNLQKLSGSGVRCSVAVKFDVKILADNGDTITISFTANFAQELKIGVNASGDLVWGWKWIIPYPKDYHISSNLDVYDYTGISFEAYVTSMHGTIDITKQIQKILQFTNSTQITSGVQNLFEQYSSMMENDTDWIDLCSKRIFSLEFGIAANIVKVRITADFVVSADVNAALGCSYEYINGTRYSFWANIGARDAGSETINLIPAKHSFRLYVLGSMGLRAGVKLEFAVGIGSIDWDSIGLTAETGVYLKLCGFFYMRIDDIDKFWVNFQSGGLMNLDVGVYLDIAFKAQVLNGKYQYTPTILEKEWPIWQTGDIDIMYDFAYSPQTSTIKLKDVKKYTLPDNFFDMTYLDLKNGRIYTVNRKDKANWEYAIYWYLFSNSNFSITNGREIKINVPTGTHRMECDMTIISNGGGYSFGSTYFSPTRTFHLVWDDLNEDGYTISFDSKGGSAVSSITKQYEAAVAAPQAPVRAGYIFGGWYSNESLTSKYIFRTMPANNILLYAKWTPATDTPYQVQYYLQNLNNDGYTLYSTEILSGTTDTTVSTIGRSFEGYSYNSSVTGTVASGKINADGSLILKQYYDRNYYTLSFRPNNGGEDIVKKVKYGESISAPTVIKTGYTFKGWDRIVADSMPAVDTIYIAQWIVNEYSIDFNSNGGSSVAKIVQGYGSIVHEPIPVKASYNFLGWYRDSGLTKPYSFTIMRDENITLYAKWELKANAVYRVQHYLQNISDNNYTIFETETLYATPDFMINATAKTYTGFTYNSNIAGTVKSGIVKEDGSLVLKLYYDRNSYSISFVSNGGNTVSSITGKYGSDVFLVNPVRLGYTFDGWYSDEVLSTKFTTNKIPSANTVLYAKWLANANIPYKTEYYQQNLSDAGYSLLETVNLTGVCDSTVTAVDKIYDGFTRNSITGSAVNAGTVAADGSLVLKQYYDRNINTIQFVSNGGNDITSITGKYGCDVSEPEAPLRLDYTFVGWYSDQALTKAYTFSTMPAKSIILYAKWNMNTSIGYKIENYIEYDGQYILRATEEYTGEVNTTVTVTPMTLFGYTYNSNAQGARSSGVLTAGGNLILRMYYDRAMATITFNTNGGSSIPAITQKYGTNVNQPADPVRLGYHFDGWYDDEACNSAYIFSTMPSDNITLYAKWSQRNITTYKVEYYQQNVSDDGYTLIETETISGTCDTTVTASAKSYEGFTINNSAAGTVASGIVIEDGGLTLKLYYDRNTYTISFITTGGSEVQAITQRYGAAISAPENPTREGATFDGWYTEMSLANAYTFLYMPAKNLTLYVKWKWNNATEG